MKKSLGLLLALGIASTGLVAEESTRENSKVEENELIKPQNVSKIGWFIGAGVGMTNNIISSAYSSASGNALSPYFSFNLSGGVSIAQNARFRHLVSLDIDGSILSDWIKKQDQSVQIQGATQEAGYTLPTSQGFGIEVTLNYNVGYDLYKSDAYTLTMIGGLGIGGRYSNQTEDYKDPTDPTHAWKTTRTYSSFVMNANLGFRNVIAKHHAIDLMLKTNLVNLGSGEYLVDSVGIGKASFKKSSGSTFLISYTFLSF